MFVGDASIFLPRDGQVDKQVGWKVKGYVEGSVVCMKDLQELPSQNGAFGKSMVNDKRKYVNITNLLILSSSSPPADLICFSAALCDRVDASVLFIAVIASPLCNSPSAGLPENTYKTNILTKIRF